MLESIRSRSNGPIAKFIIGLIIIPFAFAGVYSYFNVNTGNSVATVNGEDISLQDFDRSYRFQQQRWGENFDKYYNTDERIQQFRLSVLQQIINQRLSSQAIQDMGLRISDSRLRNILIEMAEFHDENGQFDLSRYELTLRSRGFTPQQYQNARKADMASSQFMDLMQGSNFVLKHELEQNQRLQNQTRDINYLTIPQDYYAKQVDISGEAGETAINSYYELNKSQFSIPEKVSIEYLYLAKKDPSTIVLSDGQIADYYNENISDFETDEKRHLAHILIISDEDADQQSEDAAEQKIKELQNKINNGESFELIAKENSEDTLTSESGGDLDWIEKGMMDEAFEEAAFALVDTNSVSNIVRSKFGFHLIKLLELDSGAPKPIEELKVQIADILKNQIVEDSFFDLKESVSEQTFEVPDTLAEVEKSVGIVIRKSVLFDRQFPYALPKELQNQPTVIDAAFSDDVLYQGLNSPLVELTDGNAVVLRLLEHQEKGTSTLEEVRGRIISTMTTERVREATEKAGNLILDALNEGQLPEQAIESLPAEVASTWQQQLALGREGTEVSAQIRNEVFRIPTPENGTAIYKGILLGSGDYAVITLNAVNQGVINTDESKDAELDKRFMNYHSQVEIFSYLKYLDANASISRSIANAEQIQ